MEQRLSQLWWGYIVSPLFLVITTVCFYFPSLHYEFQFDDIANITKHFKIRHYAFKDLFFSGSRWISYWLNSLHYKIGKFDPFSYRLGNVLIHTLNGLFIFFILLYVLRRLKEKSFFTRNALPISFLTSLMFLLHPVQTQTVSYVIQGQLEGLAALFTFSMIACFLAIQKTNGIAKYALAFLYFFLAFFITGTKEIAIVVPFLIALVDWFFVAQTDVEDFKSRIWMHLLTAVIIFSLYLYLLKPAFFIQLFGFKIEAANNLGNIITANPTDKITPWLFFISQFKVILHYLWIFLWPFHISVEYDWVLVRGFFAPDCIFPFLFLLGLVYTVILFLRRNPDSLIGFAALWFAIAIAPRSSILPSPELLVDYKTYLASVGWLIIIACALIKGFEWATQHAALRTIARSRIPAYLLLVALTSGLGYSTYQRNFVWSSGLEFWGNIVENAPYKARAYNNYAVELSQKLGKFAESIPYFKHAIGMDKNYRDPYNNLAVAYAATHQIDKAIETLEQSLKINKFYPEAYNNIASFLIEKKNYEKAKHALSIALQLRPYYGKAYFNLGRVHLEEGELELAHDAFKKACMQADLDNEAGFLGYAKSAMQLQRYDEAIFACKKVLECNPANAETEFSLGNAYYMAEQFDNAIGIYQRLVQRDPQDSRLWYNLAEAHFSAGNTQKALEYFNRLKGLPGIGLNLYIRIAACFEKIGLMAQAKQSLQELLQKPLNQDDRVTVQAAINKLQEQYGVA